MHIVHVGISYRTETLDGRMRAVSAYARHQAEMGHQVTMIQLVSPGETVEPPEPNDRIRQLTFGVRRPSFRLGSEVSRLFRDNSLRGDIYHFHSSYARHWAASRLLPVPYVVSPHGAYAASDMARKRLRSLGFRFTVGRPYLRNAARVHAVTLAEAAAVTRFAGPLPLVVIPNCLEGSFSFDPVGRVEVRAQLGVAEDEALVLYLGRLDVVGKGLDVLVEGFGLALSRTAAPMRLVLAGPFVRPDGRRLERGVGAAERELAELVGEAIRGQVSILPPLFGAEKQRLLAAADAFVTLSRWDVMPTGVLDALGSGLPLIVTEETGFAGFVRMHKTGQVVSHDPGAVANALLAAGTTLESTRRQQIFEAADANFNPRRTAERFVAVYEDAAGRKLTDLLTGSETTEAGPRARLN